MGFSTSNGQYLSFYQNIDNLSLHIQLSNLTNIILYYKKSKPTYIVSVLILFLLTLCVLILIVKNFTKA